MPESSDFQVVIIGGGPAGLTAAYELGKAGVATTVLEQDVVGGLAKTVNHNGFRFDIGGHRFYTKVKAVDDIWREILPPADFLRRKRLSRIYYNKRFFHYPLKLSSTLSQIGIVRGLLILLSYLRARVLPHRTEATFEQWVTNRFGKRLYSIFFKPYTEKIWGIPCNEITADWASQRIKGLSLLQVLIELLTRSGDSGKTNIKSLINEFDYPRLGPGMMWDTMARAVRRQGGEVRENSRVERLNWDADSIISVEIVTDGTAHTVAGTHFISSMPIRELVSKLSPAPPTEVRAAADSLKYRDFITVALIVNNPAIFPDNWIYVHDPDVKVGRVQNYKNWSQDMVPEANKTCLGLEYFCFEGDGLWTMSDDELVQLGARELEKLGLIKAGEVEAGSVVRVPKAYPVYDSTYRQSLNAVINFFRGINNLQLVGRNGMHRYNNQDHSMLTGSLAAKNILGASYDLWDVNADSEYQEERRLERHAADDEHRRALAALNATQPFVPERIRSLSTQPQVEFET